MLHVVHIFLDIHKQHDLVFHNTNKDYLYIGVVSLAPWKAWILFYQFAQGHLLVRLLKAKLALHVGNSFVLSIWVHGAFLVDVLRTCYHIEQLMQWPNLMLKGLARWVVTFLHHFIIQIKTDLWMLVHPMKYYKPTFRTLMHIPQLNMILDKNIIFWC